MTTKNYFNLFRLASTVTGYLVHLRRMTPPVGEQQQQQQRKSKKPGREMVWRTKVNDYVLEDLEPDSSYEVIRLGPP